MRSMWRADSRRITETEVKLKVVNGKLAVWLVEPAHLIRGMNDNLLFKLTGDHIDPDEAWVEFHDLCDASDNFIDDPHRDPNGPATICPVWNEFWRAG